MKSQLTRAKEIFGHRPDMELYKKVPGANTLTFDERVHWTGLYQTWAQDAPQTLTNT